jgi:hypothetical protein
MGLMFHDEATQVRAHKLGEHLIDHRVSLPLSGHLRKSQQ